MKLIIEVEKDGNIWSAQLLSPDKIPVCEVFGLPREKTLQFAVGLVQTVGEILG